jgi:hypothetical protein
MSTDFSLFRERLAEACRVRDMKPEAVYRSVGLGGRRALDLRGGISIAASISMAKANAAVKPARKSRAAACWLKERPHHEKKDLDI